MLHLPLSPICECRWQVWGLWGSGLEGWGGEWGKAAVIVCTSMMSNQTAQMMASLLDWSQGTFASKIEKKDDDILEVVGEIAT